MWPFKRKPSPDTQRDSRSPVTPQANLVKRIGTRFGMVEIPSLDLLCASSVSPNGDYMIAWADSSSDSRGTVGGHRAKGHGTFVFIANEKILCQSKNLERPNKGKVADNGTFILIDAFFGTSTDCDAYIFAKDGTEILRLRLTAKAVDTAISADGRFAIIQLAGSKTKDANCLVFVDISERGIVWKSDAAGWADSYHFDNDTQRLRLVYADKGPYEYSYAGDFLSTKPRDQDRVLSMR